MVILPQDRADKKESDSEAQPKVTDPISKATKIEEDSSKTRITEKTNLSEANKAKAAYTTPQTFLLLTAPSLLQAYLAPDSAFQKIIQALGVPQVANYINTDITIIRSLENYKCVWCIGLDLKDVNAALATKHPNLIVSPDILTLSDNESKKAMYVPLKEFMLINLGLISHI